MTVFYTWPFPADKGTYIGPGPDTRVGRTLPVRLSDIVNVKDWGAVGDGSAVGPKIQAAIDFCIARGGGKVFFPPGQYNSSTVNLVVGTDDSAQRNNFVQLIGGGGSNTAINGPSTGWVISKGTKAYDLIQRVEGMMVTSSFTGGGIKLTGKGVQVRNCVFNSCLVMVDAAQAKGATISDCGGDGGDGTDGDASGPKVFSSTGVCFYLGDNGTITNCRISGGTWITYALSGTGAQIQGCSTEVTYTCARLGWAPDANPLVIGGGRELPAIGCTVSGMQTERHIIHLDLYNCVGCYITANWLSGGEGVPNHQPITNLVWSSTAGGTVTATTIGVHRLPGPAGTVTNLLLGIQGRPEPTDWRPTSFTPCTNINSTQFTYPCPNPGYPFSGTISGMSWDISATGSPPRHLVTVTIANTGTALPLGTQVQLSNISASWSPDSVTLPFNVSIISSSPTSFTYWGPNSAASGDNVGNWDMRPNVGWTYPSLHAIRCRKVRETLIIGAAVVANSSLGSVDLQYGPVPQPYVQTNEGGAVHSNNTMVNLIGERGWLPPLAQNAAGWKFINCGISGLATFSNPSATISPGGTLTFINLPGNLTQDFDPDTGEPLYQTGPFEGQEYDIADGRRLSDGGVAGWNESVQGGGTGKYKVRYDGAVWRRIG